MQNNKRRLVRHELNASIDVWDAQSDEHLGRLANIHAQGLMLLSDAPLVEERLYSLRLTLPQSLVGAGELTLAVDCLWVKSSEDESRHWAGCHIIDISDQGLAVVELLISRLR
ncbi:PilZ domain-containing protein [Simiduia litorea]|uniref:PilZ domain-containing protein n=1 Tax=Simiduia litorea TaxID=1435348 RepID=UPI0036F413B2